MHMHMHKYLHKALYAPTEGSTAWYLQYTSTVDLPRLLFSVPRTLISAKEYGI